MGWDCWFDTERGALLIRALLAAGVFSLSSTWGQAEGIKIADAPKHDVDFEKEIAPIFARSCTACHNATKASGELSLETPQTIQKGGKEGPAALPGKPDESLLLRLASHQDEPFMPPPKNKAEAPNLKSEELGLIKLWIEQGAKGTVSVSGKPIEWRPLPIGVNPILAVAVSEDGQYVACTRANQVIIHHAATGEVVTRLSDPELLSATADRRPGIADLDLVQSLAFSPSGDLLATGGFRTIRIWQRPRNPVLWQRSASNATAAAAIAASPDGKWLATAIGNVIELSNAASGAVERTLTGHAAAVTGVAFTPDSKRLISVSADRSLLVWNPTDGTIVGRIDAPTALTAVTVLGSDLIATGSVDNLIRLWKLPGASPGKFESDRAITALVPPDGKKIVAAKEDGSIESIEIAGNARVKFESRQADGFAAFQLSADGTKVASAGWDGRIALADAATGKTLIQMTAPKSVSAVSIHPSGPQLVTGFGDGTMTLWRLDVPAARAIAKANVVSEVVAASADGKLIAVATSDQNMPALAIHDAEKGALVKSIAVDASPTSIGFSADNSRIAIGAQDGSTRVVNLADGKEAGRHAAISPAVVAVALSPNGQTAASASSVGSITIWNVADGKEQRRLIGPAAKITRLAWHPNGQAIISSSLDQTVRVWNAADGAIQRVLPHSSPISVMAVSRDGNRLAVGGPDRLVRVYQMDGNLLRTLDLHSKPISGLSFNHDGARLAVAATNGRVVIVETATWEPIEVVERPVSASLLAWSADGQQLLVADEKNAVESVALRYLRTIAGNGRRIVKALFNRDGSLIYSASDDGTLRANQTSDGGQRWATHHGSMIFDLTQSPSGEWLATAGESNVIRVWNASNGNGAPKPQLEGFAGPIRSVSFSSDNQRVVGTGVVPGDVLAFSLADGVAEQRFAGGAGATATFVGPDRLLFGVGSGGLSMAPLAAVRRMAGHGNRVTALAPATGGTQLLSGSEDQTLRLWDVASGRELRQIYHGAPVTSVAVRADGKRWASGGAGNIARLWNAENGQQVAEIRGDLRLHLEVGRAERALTLAQTRLNDARILSSQLDQELPQKMNAAKATADAKAAADKIVEEKQAAAKKVGAEKELAVKEATAAAESVKKAQETKSAAEKALAEAQAVAKKAAEAAESAKKAAAADANNKSLADAAANAAKNSADAVEKAKAAETAKANADKALAEVEPKARMLAEKASAVSKQSDEAEKALADASAAQKIADSVAKTAADDVTKLQARIGATKTEVAAAESNQKQAEESLNARRKAQTDSEKPIRAVAFSPNGKTLAAAGDSSSVHLFDSETGARIDVFDAPANPTANLAFASDRLLMASAGSGAATTWDLGAEWKLVRRIGKQDDPAIIRDRVLALDFSRDGTLLASGSGDPSRSGEVKVWKTADGSLLHALPEAHTDMVADVAFSPDGKRVASASADKLVRLIDVGTGKITDTLEGHTHHVLSVTWKADGKQIATGGADDAVRIWDAQTGEQLRMFGGYSKQVTSTNFIGVTNEILATAGDKSVRVIRSDDGAVLRGYGGPTDFVYASAATPDGSLIIAGGHDSILRFWNGPNSQLIRAIEPPKP